MNKSYGLLKEKVTLITGASRGIGKEMVECFAREGAIVYANARKEGSIDKWAEELSDKYNTQVIPLYFDVTDKSSVKQSILRIKKENRKLDVLVNNAGITSNQLLSYVTRDTMKNLFEVNVFAVIEMIQLAAKLMLSNKSGSIINISSIVGQRGNKGQLAYSATKGAVISLTKTAAKELAQYNIRVNSVAPGLIDTDAMKDVEQSNMEKRISNIAMGRLGKPEDISNACLFLASDLSSYISGEIIGVNGCAIM
ncbi:3-oxoacyl-ACP reductase [Clostridium botulinum]|uniref:SDR family NAD(P)-dependent oxidoreductase n=1 Tax=Clostridium botulinum TaxID=1491 RepID=UPI000597C888|nr:glucose 1-dehydrogenase [Clostridium botulinum]KIL08039.1 3-oxoacyl-ACP reductase [Clostridium botulinum]MBY6933622.1 glucose 1-dehydrogenase [Clostridium botulinum]NFL83039.1 glucose 1-dehydrogenase [Clostridium botulinum]NFN10467.1 glucose 1-dehydrogenase [Clostridium botulinum]NFN80062.1 glucose 1-dehydrogenase [Clostridium botulinum]